MMIGERLRDTRQAQRLSLTEVATKAGISAATLSRIETNKQGIDLALFLTLARLLKAEPHELLGENGAEHDDDLLARKIAALASGDRIRMWHDLTAARRGKRKSARRELNGEVEELLAQLEYIKVEIESVRAHLRRR